MKTYKEESLICFEFWGGAKDRVKYLTVNELDQMDKILEECYPDGISETQLNDIFWFDDDWVAEMLGYSDFEELRQERIKEDF